MSSIDNLKRDAKRWLRKLRSGDEEAWARWRAARGADRTRNTVVLREVQHAMAKERGLGTWRALIDDAAARDAARPGTPTQMAPPAALAASERLAADWVRAHDDADPAALERLSAHYARTVTAAEVRALAWQGSEDVRRSRRFALADAQALLAREAGFPSWALLAGHLAEGTSRAPQVYALDTEKGSIRPRRALDDAEWEAMLEVIAERRISSVEAGGEITDRRLASLSRLGCVTRLDLGGANRLTDDGLRHLARMPQLQELDLSNHPGGQITDRGLAVLRDLPELRAIALCWQPRVTDAGAAHLGSCARLESVDLMGTPSGDGAIRALAGKRDLQRLKTGRNVTDAGLPALHAIPGFTRRSGAEPRCSLMSPDSGASHLQLDGPFTDAGLAALSGLDGLFGLSFFWHCRALSPAGLARLAALPNLGHLGCGGELCDDEAMRHLAAIPRLRMLMAQGTVATDAGFEALAASPSLEYLWGRECPNLTGRGFAALSRLPALRGLAVSCARVDEQALARLPSFPALVELLPMDVSDAGFRHVGGCARLESLWCMYCRDTTDAATEHLAGLTRLSFYYAGKTRITDRSLEIIGRLRSLERVELWQTPGITDRGLPALAALPKLRAVTIHGVPQVTLEGTAVFPPRVKVDYSVAG